VLSVVESWKAGRSWSRRELLRVGGLALGGLTLGELCRGRAASVRAAEPGAPGSEKRSYVRDKSVVLLVLQGGAPQIETFDPKLDGPAYSRSVTGNVPTSLPGLHFGGTFPKLARLAHKLAVVHSFQTGRGRSLSHEAGYTSLLTAGNTLEAPLSALYARAAGNLHHETAMPRSTVLVPEAVDADLELGQPTRGFRYRDVQQYFAKAGRLGGSYDAFNPAGGTQLLDDLQLELPRGRFEDRWSLLERVEHLRHRVEHAPEVGALESARQKAYEVLLAGISGAFDIAREDTRTLERYDTSALVPIRDIRPGGRWHHKNFSRTTNVLGKQMLLARRLCEAGCGFVTVVDSCWDFHDDGTNAPVNVGMEVLGHQADHAITTFLEDVEERGLSDRILLIVTSEFGRMPQKEGVSRGGSGHWGDLTPLLLAGGGLNMGQVIGHSERTGAYPDTEPYAPRHLLSTVLRTVFDVGEVRLREELPREVRELITEGEPISELGA
jgi:hypothetical protein